MFRYCGAACHGVVIVKASIVQRCSGIVGQPYMELLLSGVWAVSTADIYKSNTLFYPVIANTFKVSQRDYRRFTQLVQALLIPYDL